VSWQDIPGWSEDIIPFYEFIEKEIPQGGTFVEVGVFLGRSLCCMATRRPDLDIWAIDPWLTEPSSGFLGLAEMRPHVEPHGSLWRAFHYHMARSAPEVYERVHVLRTVSEHGLRAAPQADMIFIDGAHDYDHVYQDIALSLLRLKDSGILAGHDYGHPQCPGVAQAVDNLLPDRKLMDTCWYVKR
jgi:hypothetical protein